MQRSVSLVRLFLCTFGLAATSLAQGSDDCATPTAINGPGVFGFNNTTATTSPQGQTNPACNKFGTPGITHDVWFNWTATSTGQIEISTCGGTNIDSKIAVYAGAGCPIGAPLDCNDDTCGVQSTVVINATAGSVYAIQLGCFPSASGAAGTFTIGVFTPPPPCSPSAGPDVIVGEIQEVENEPPTATLDAISLGTTSCNVGTTNLSWIAGNNQHPVIGGNLYRYSVVDGAGRFEQVGMSWLKHGFFALSIEVCCTGCQGTDGSSLGVNCADPYTASRNGSQGNLGPRYQVNAHTGFFVYPPANPGWAGTTARRCEFALADIVTTSGARYFGECQYVTPDDAAAGNQNNNASYREMAVGGSAADRSFAFVASTQRQKAAIEAWPLAEPGTVLHRVQVPGDGLFIVGYHVTALGGGQHRYEYAVYNMNGDRSGGSFSIPIPAGINVTNIGFHDVSYRNGDGNGNLTYSGTDWVSTLAGGSLTWAAETQAVNPNGNALRWGTTYNFRFDADAAPVLAPARIGLWKPGTPSFVTTGVQGPGGASTSFGYCYGDGAATACPCANNSAAQSVSGCLNSTGTGGQLVAQGVPSVSADTLSLEANGMPNSAALFFQGTTQVAAGNGAVFGDGLRCAAGTVIRFGTDTIVGGASAYPGAGDPSVSVQGANVAGGVRTYQCWYRNDAAFCSADAFNLTNAWRVTWLP